MTLGHMYEHAMALEDSQIDLQFACREKTIICKITVVKEAPGLHS